jgi:hypothetical protein
MAQVDFANYFSILFWFYIIFVIYYLVNYSLLLPSIYSTLKVRKNIYIFYFIKIKVKIQNTIKGFNVFFYIKKFFNVLFFLLKKSTYIV